MKSLNEKSYETELNAIKALLPELDEIIHKNRADNQFKIERKAKNDLICVSVYLYLSGLFAIENISGLPR